MSERPTERDLGIIARQLGRPPRGVVAIERRCRWGFPQVIKVYPLLKEGSKWEPFPTLFWLTCPTLIRQLAKLEHQSYIARLERLIAEDERFRMAYRKNHEEYIAERWATLSPEDREFLERQGLAEALRQRGIGGLADWDKVKCLHLHYAHHLARENVVGRWLAEHFPLEECLPERVICAELAPGEGDLDHSSPG